MEFDRQFDAVVGRLVLMYIPIRSRLCASWRGMLGAGDWHSRTRLTVSFRQACVTATSPPC
jgi:hypothetical protein